MGIDPVGVNESNIHSFNRYGYANNNPYKYVDPDGRAVETVWDVANLAMGVASFGANLNAGNYAGAGLDAAGIIVDAVATGVPFVPGGAGTAIQAYRGSKLARSMDDVGRGVIKGKEEAHHIVAQGSKFASRTRDILKDVGIDIDNAVNGARVVKGEHRGLHTKEYYERVDDMVSDAYVNAKVRGDDAKAAVESALSRIREKYDWK